MQCISGKSECSHYSSSLYSINLRHNMIRGVTDLVCNGNATSNSGSLPSPCSRPQPKRDLRLDRSVTGSRIRIAGSLLVYSLSVNHSPLDIQFRVIASIAHALCRATRSQSSRKIMAVPRNTQLGVGVAAQLPSASAIALLR